MKNKNIHSIYTVVIGYKLIIVTFDSATFTVITLGKRKKIVHVIYISNAKHDIHFYNKIQKLN